MTTRRTLSLLAASALVALLPGPRALRSAKSPPSPTRRARSSSRSRRPSRWTTAWRSRSFTTARCRRCSIRLAILTGNVNEGAKQVWLADLTGDMLQEGTATRTASQIAEEVAKMGGELAVGGENRTKIGGDVLSESGSGHGRPGRGRRPPSEVPGFRARASEGGLGSRQLSIALSQSGRPRRRVPSRALRRPPVRAPLPDRGDAPQAYTLADVRGFYTLRRGPRAHLYVVGRFDDASMEAAIRKAFSDWEKGPAPPELAARAAHRARGLTLVDRPGAVQSTITLGMPVIDPSKPDWARSLSPTSSSAARSPRASRPTSASRRATPTRPSASSPTATARRVLGRGRRRDDERHRTGDQGDPRRDRPPEGGAAVRQAELKGFQNYRAGVLHPPELVAGRHHRAARVRGPCTVFRMLPQWLRRARVRRDAAAGAREWRRSTSRTDKATIVVVGDKKVIEEQLKPYQPPAGQP